MSLAGPTKACDGRCGSGNALLGFQLDEVVIVVVDGMCWSQRDEIPNPQAATVHPCASPHPAR